MISSEAKKTEQKVEIEKKIKDLEKSKKSFFMSSAAKLKMQ